MTGGEIFVPKIPSTTIIDLAEAIAPDASLDIIGVRPGEKLHEEMISENDAFRTFVLNDRYVIAPLLANWQSSALPSGSMKVPEGFSYSSDANDWFLDVHEIRALLDSQT
jgi:UDP-N-acetylglucosamine 4,6-dehydratase